MKIVPILSVVLLAASALSLRADPEIAVAMRYYIETGVSYSHIYLYKEDGKLLRQLTDGTVYQDSNPFFSPDGETIVFTRFKGDDKDIADGDNKGKTIWSIEPKGNNLQQLDASPEWYKEAETATCYTDSDSIGKPVPTEETDVISSTDTEVHYKISDGSGELVNKLDFDNDKSTFTFIDKAGNHKMINGLAGNIAGLKEGETNHFLMDPPMRLAFIDRHLDSSDGDTMMALDLNTFTIHELPSVGHAEKDDAKDDNRLQAPGFVYPIPLPGEQAFLSVTGVRYVVYGTGTKTENSSYLERRNSTFHCVCYAHKGAAVFYGGSIYRSALKPTVIWIPRN